MFRVPLLTQFCELSRHKKQRKTCKIIFFFVENLMNRRFRKSLRKLTYKGFVKFAGKMPFSVDPSFVPISQPSSCGHENCVLSCSLIISSILFSFYLILGIFVLNNVDDISNFKAQFIAILSDVFVSCLDAVQNARRQISGCGT